MKVHVHNAYLNATQGIDALNATHDVKRALRESQIQDGLMTVSVPSSTAAVVILENDPSIHEEFKKVITSFIAEPQGSRPSRKSGTGHIESHLKAALLPNSVSIPIKEGRLLMGHWQEVIVFDFDNKMGRREVCVHVMGEGKEKKG